MTLAVRTPTPEDRPRPPLFAKSADNTVRLPSFVRFDAALFFRFNARLRAQTAECVMATFGISVNTWLKMRKGMPIRKSVAERLVRRISADL
ncbi:MAG: hypothetical protein J0626_06140 [Rhodospirillaceae bacterium]|nr:hypothetical protein [Rhodospirillaceae bacterium]